MYGKCATTSRLLPNPRSPTRAKFTLHLKFRRLSDWQSVAHWFDGLAKPQEQANDAIRATVAKITAGKTTETEKARACYDWVANQTRYVGLEFGLSAFRPHPAAEAHEKLYGDYKDKAISADFHAKRRGDQSRSGSAQCGGRHSPLRNESAKPRTPFNHCIAQAQIDGKTVWLDATAETCAYGDIPEADRGAQALCHQRRAKANLKSFRRTCRKKTAPLSQAA